MSSLLPPRASRPRGGSHPGAEAQPAPLCVCLPLLPGAGVAVDQHGGIHLWPAGRDTHGLDGVPPKNLPP